jgi:tetratricopeptide (TPR) repeat protein
MIAAAFFILLAMVPLILTPWNFELFEFNKMLAVYAGAAVIAGAWVIECVRRRRFIFRRTPLDLPLGLFLISQIISTVLSIDRHTSVWGYYSRFHGGLISTICYLILYWAYAAFMTAKTKQVIAVILSTGLIVSLYGIAEHFGIDKHLWIQDVQNRVFATLGQPNWLAAYLIMLIPLAAGGPRARWLAPVYLAALYFTRSRSGYLGLGVAGLVYSLLKRPKAALIGLALIIAGGYFGRHQLPVLQPTQGLAEETPLAQTGGSSSSAIRRVVWQGAIEIWKHYPIFGSGVETFAYSYYNFRPAEHNLLSEWDYLYNKAHNEFLNFLATTGAFGLGAYLLLMTATIWWLIKQQRPELLAGYIGVNVANFFGFSVVPVAMLFYLWPALALAPAPPEKLSHRRLNNFQAVAIACLSLIIFYCLLFVAKLWRADYLFNLGRNQVKAKLPVQGYDNLRRAVALSPQEPVFRNDLAEAEAQLAFAYASPAAELSRQFLELAVKDADQTIAQNPVNLNFWRSRIKIFLILSELNPDYYNEVLRAFDRAMALAPTDPKLTYNLALVYSQLGQTGQAEQLLVKTIDLKPNYEACRNSLGSLYEQTGRPDLARQQYEYILKYLNPDNAAAKQRLEKLP